MAAEVAFLKAEAKGVFGFNMGSGEAKDFYDEGIRLSFEEWGVSGADTYLANTTGKPQLYADPANSNSYAQELSDITIAWDEGATPAQMQERIITQKWIANWQLGNEAWPTTAARVIPSDACHRGWKQESRGRRFRTRGAPYALSGRRIHDQQRERQQCGFVASEGYRQHGDPYVVGLQPRDQIITNPNAKRL